MGVRFFAGGGDDLVAHFFELGLGEFSLLAETAKIAKFESGGGETFGIEHATAGPGADQESNDCQAEDNEADDDDPGGGGADIVGEE